MTPRRTNQWKSSCQMSRCNVGQIAEPPPPSHGRLVVGAFVMHKWYQGWQHHVIDASVRFDLALPLLQAGYRVSWLHGGMLDNDMVSLRCLVPKQCALRFVEKRVGVFQFCIRLPHSGKPHGLATTATLRPAVSESNRSRALASRGSKTHTAHAGSTRQQRIQRGSTASPSGFAS